MLDADPIATPVFIPERRSQIPQLVKAAFGLLSSKVEERLQAFVDQPSREGFLELEQDVLRLFSIMSSHSVAGVVGLLHKDKGWVADAVAAERTRSTRRLRHRGVRSTLVRFLGGVVLAFSTPYLSQDLRGRSGPTRRVGRRGKTGSGRYPALEALGVMHRTTPALASEVARQSVRTASFVEAQQAIAERGIDVTKETVRAISVKVGREAVRQRDARVAAAASGETFTEEFVGERVVISADGGRLRVREGGQTGRKGKSRHRRFRTPWREPKLVSAYLVDMKGKKKRKATPHYDGTLADADAACRILGVELKLGSAAKAKELILVADGTLWIFDRADELERFHGIDPSRIVKVADFYHAVAQLTEIADRRA